MKLDPERNIFLILNPFCLVEKQKRKPGNCLWKFLFSRRKLSLSILSYKVHSIVKTITSSNPAEVMFAINLLKMFIGGLSISLLIINQVYSFIFVVQSQLSQGVIFKGTYLVISYNWLSGTSFSIDIFIMLGTFKIYSVYRNMFYPL